MLLEGATGPGLRLWRSCSEDLNRIDFALIEVEENGNIPGGLLAMIELLGQGTIVVLRGTWLGAWTLQERFSRLVAIADISRSLAAECLCRICVEIREGLPIALADIEPVRLPLPLSGPARALDLVPAHLVCAHLGERLKGRYPMGSRPAPGSIDHALWEVENFLGLHLTVQPGAFVPDPSILELILGAFLPPTSVLRRDLREARVVEPCTGTGIIAIALARLGASFVWSSDVNAGAVSSARSNVRRAGLEDRISVQEHDGLMPVADADLLIINPTWNDLSVSRLDGDILALGASNRRKPLLARILSQARKAPGLKAAYVFLDSRSPILDPARAELGLTFFRDLGWLITDRWTGQGPAQMVRIAPRP